MEVSGSKPTFGGAGADSTDMNETLLTVFVGLTALAVLIQMGVLLAILVSFKKPARYCSAKWKKICSP